MSDSDTILPPAALDLDEADEDAWASPPGPLCEKCEHAMCPMCPSPWCDHLIGEDMQSCCDTSCTVDPFEFADWKERAAAVMFSRDHRCGAPIEEHTCWTDELGPYCPTWRRQVRGCNMCMFKLGAEDAPRASYIATGASGLEWYECPEHDELDNLAEDRRVRRVLLCDYLARLARVLRGMPKTRAALARPPEGEQ